MLMFSFRGLVLDTRTNRWVKRSAIWNFFVKLVLRPFLAFFQKSSLAFLVTVTKSHNLTNSWLSGFVWIVSGWHIEIQTLLIFIWKPDLKEILSRRTLSLTCNSSGLNFPKPWPTCIPATHCVGNIVTNYKIQTCHLNIPKKGPARLPGSEELLHLPVPRRDSPVLSTVTYACRFITVPISASP